MNDELKQRIAALCDLDRQLFDLLQKNELETEEITHLVDKRQQHIHYLIAFGEQHADLKQTSQWLQIVKSTQQISELMQSKTQQLGLTLQKVRHGNKSIKQYQKFI
ncbi:flagellar protein FliT [Vibrio hippocampi]|uniref:Flagellar protein FliT n=1 Tax=Vibrio hippocampi TaxID=654686 RepID=A0ABN8DHL5_9VIBR|nr:flagellar protein FliT [Vibrio hippocampi]CAH0525164.1 hypothetical protein VHP8226_00831 [Vibrio hippocampi]